MLLGVQLNGSTVSDPRSRLELLVLRDQMTVDDRGQRLLPDQLAVGLGRGRGAQRVLVELDLGETGRRDAERVNDRAVVGMDHRLCGSVGDFDGCKITYG